MARERRPTLFRATERIYVTPQGKVVGKGYAGFKRLLVGEGGVMSAVDADRHGLTGMPSFGSTYDPDAIPPEHPAAHGLTKWGTVNPDGSSSEGASADDMNAEAGEKESSRTESSQKDSSTIQTKSDITQESTRHGNTRRSRSR